MFAVEQPNFVFSKMTVRVSPEKYKEERGDWGRKFGIFTTVTDVTVLLYYYKHKNSKKGRVRKV